MCALISQIAPLKQTLRKVVQNREADPRVVYDLVMIGDMALPQKGLASLIVYFQLPNQHPSLRFAKKKDRVNYWGEQGKSVLPLDSLVVMIQDGVPQRFAKVESSPSLSFFLFHCEDYVCFLPQNVQVVRREPEELAGYGDTTLSAIGLSFPDVGAWMNMLDCVAETRNRRINMKLVQATSSYFSFEPVLRKLQSMVRALTVLSFSNPKEFTHLGNL